jgi:TRAP transporter TAXI family solute receptor
MKCRNLLKPMGCGILILLLSLGLAVLAFTPTFAAEKKLPNLIGLSTYSSGSVGYAVFSAMGLAIEKKTGMKVRVAPAGTAKGRLLPSLLGHTLISATVYADYAAMAGGIWDWAIEGPQVHNFVMVWSGGTSQTALFARGDSGINTWEDMRGKRIADATGFDESVANRTNAKLAFGGLTLADMVKVPVAGYPANMKAVLEGTADLAYGSPVAGDCVALAASVHGLKWFAMPPDNEEAWKRVRAVAPYLFPYLETVGVGVSKEKPLWMVGQPYIWSTSPKADEYTIYRIVKAIIEGFDLYKNVHPQCPRWNLDQALDIKTLYAIGVPYHPGAVRAFKEIGRWTKEHERWQRSRLDFAPMVMKEYDQVVSWAVANKVTIGSKEFIKEWEPRWHKVYASIPAK